jgi:hypothetical protein
MALPDSGAAALELCSHFVLKRGMRLFLRPQRANDTPGRQPGSGSDNDYVVIDGTPIDRIYADRLPSGEKWLRFLHILRATPNQGVAIRSKRRRSPRRTVIDDTPVTCGNT